MYVEMYADCDAPKQKVGSHPVTGLHILPELLTIPEVRVIQRTNPSLPVIRLRVIS
jgi:hypothetical protein